MVNFDQILPELKAVPLDSPRIPGAQSGGRLTDTVPQAAGITAQPIRLDLARLRAAGIIPLEHLGAQGMDEYRRIKHPLLVNAFGGGLPPVDRGRIIMVTSALPGEGKTHTSINLALCMAREIDSSVLLVDADIVKADTTSLLGLRDRPGLVDLLDSNGEGANELLLHTDIPRLAVLPCGRKRYGGSAELLSSRALPQVLDELSGRFPNRLIILDAPPLLVTIEAQILAGVAGQVIVVVEAMRTPQQALQEALAKLDPQRQVVGLVLNKGKKSLDPYYHGSYYGQ